MIRGAMRKVTMLALQGNLAALRLLLDRTLGRAAEVPTGEPLDIQPPKLRTAADCTAAVQKVTDAICQGSIDLLQGKVLLDAIATQCKLLEVTALEAQLAELEKQAATVDLRTQRR